MAGDQGELRQLQISLDRMQVGVASAQTFTLSLTSPGLGWGSGTSESSSGRSSIGRGACRTIACIEITSTYYNQPSSSEKLRRGPIAKLTDRAYSCST